MAAYTVAAGSVGKYEIAHAATVEDNVTFTGTSVSYVEVTQHSGAKPVYFKVGGTATVRGADCRVVFPGTSVEFVNKSNAITVVSFISEADAVVSVASSR